jgi:hypothetical protein
MPSFSTPPPDSRDPKIECVFVANGEIHAQQIRSFLEAGGIVTAIRGESLRHTHGLTIDGAGAVEILVSSEDAPHARLLLESAEAGTFRLPDDAGSVSD